MRKAGNQDSGRAGARRSGLAGSETGVPHLSGPEVRSVLGSTESRPTLAICNGRRPLLHGSLVFFYFLRFFVSGISQQRNEGNEGIYKGEVVEKPMNFYNQLSVVN